MYFVAAAAAAAALRMCSIALPACTSSRSVVTQRPWGAKETERKREWEEREREREREAKRQGDRDRGQGQRGRVGRQLPAHWAGERSH